MPPRSGGKLISWRSLPATVAHIFTLGRYTREPVPEASPAEREAHVRRHFGELLRATAHGIPESVLQQAAEESVTKILASMNVPAGKTSAASAESDKQA